MAYQVSFQRTVVHLRYENFNCKAGRDDRAQYACCHECKWNLEKLALKPLRPREDRQQLAGDRVADLLVRFEVAILRRQDRNSSDLPADAEIDFLPFPVLHKYDTPETIHDGIDRGEVSQCQPAGKTKERREEQGSEIGLQERKVEPNLKTHISFRSFRSKCPRVIATFSPYLSRI